MKLGLLTPIVSLNPRAHNDWERDATVADLVAIARAADTAGFHHLTCSDHVAVPPGASGHAGLRGARYWDPFSTLGHLAAVTESIRLATFVLVLGYHHPLAIVKRCSTVDVLSRGRAVVGVGVGSLREEFDLLGADWDDRGAVADDALRALRASFGVAEPSYDGSHFSFGGLVVDPVCVQSRPPLWVGGRTRRSLRRAVELADGWVPFGLGSAEVGGMVADVDLPDGFEVVLWPDGATDPLGDPDRFRRAIDDARAAGATGVNLRFASSSPPHHVDQLTAAADLVG